MGATILPLGYYTDQGPEGCGQCDGQGEYYGLSTASEVFLILTTHLYSCYAFIMQSFSYFDKRGVLQQEDSQFTILPFLHFRWVLNASVSILKMLLSSFSIVNIVG